MSRLNELIANQKNAESALAAIKQQVKDERASIAKEKKKESNEEEWLSVRKELASARDENSRLRRLIAILMRNNDHTYKVIAKELDCSATRARQIVKIGLSRLSDDHNLIEAHNKSHEVK